MGGAQDKPIVIDANNQMRVQQEDQKIEEFLKKAFKQASTEKGILYKDRFNEALSILESLNKRRIRDTPLADRLFFLMDKNKDGQITEQEYLEVVKQLINDKEKRISYSFQVFDKDADGRVSRQEFYEYFKDSWISAFRILGEQVNRNQNSISVSISKINNWAQVQLPQLHQQVDNLFVKLDPRKTDFLDYQCFRQWVISDDQSSIRALFDGNEVEISLTLYKFDAKQRK